MGGFLGSSKPDTSAAEAQIAETRAETKRLKAQALEDKRTKGESESAKRMARLRGGNRALLSSLRDTGEMGVEDETLGA
tara:strand:- start:3080 stop:3316 length:237 start_codon:yes stop_codon:yes gene_type:complete